MDHQMITSSLDIFVKDQGRPIFPVKSGLQIPTNVSIVSENSEVGSAHGPCPDFTPSTLPANPNNDKSVAKKKVKTKKFRSHQCEKWQEQFHELLAFREKHGHCLVPHKYEPNPALAGWVKRQRYQYNLNIEGKKSTITKERIRILNNFGFIWDSHEAVWQERLRELEAFKKQHGNCAVPCNYHANPKLGTWAKCQRRQYKLYVQGKTCNIDGKRIIDLEKLGFEWEGTRSNKILKDSKSTSLLSTEEKLTNSSDYDMMLDVLSILSDGSDDEMLNNHMSENIATENRRLQVPTQLCSIIDSQDGIEGLPGYMSDLSDSE